MHPPGQKPPAATPPTPYLPDTGDYNSLVHYRRWMIEPYAAVYVTQDDVVLIKVWSPGVASAVNVSIRVQMPDGRIVVSFYSYSLATVGGTPAQQVIDQVEGFLLSATVETPGAPSGQCFVQLQIVRGRGTGDQTAGQLLTSGYPGPSAAIGFPQTPATTPAAGAGQAATSTVSNPAAGADWTYTVPAGVQQTLISVRAVLTTGGAALTAPVILRITSPTGQIIADVAAISAQGAGATVTYSWVAGAQSTSSANFQQMSLPTGLRLLPGSTIQTITAGIAAPDQWSAITVSYTQFISA